MWRLLPYFSRFIIPQAQGNQSPTTPYYFYSSLWLITIDSIISLQFHLPYKIPSPVSLLWLYYVVFSKVIVHDYYDSSFVRIFRVMLSINDRFCLTVKSPFLQSNIIQNANNESFYLLHLVINHHHHHNNRYDPFSLIKPTNHRERLLSEFRVRVSKSYVLAW